MDYQEENINPKPDNFNNYKKCCLLAILKKFIKEYEDIETPVGCLSCRGDYPNCKSYCSMILLTSSLAFLTSMILKICLFKKL